MEWSEQKKIQFAIKKYDIEMFNQIFFYFLQLSEKKTCRNVNSLTIPDTQLWRFPADFCATRPFAYLYSYNKVKLEKG